MDTNDVSSERNPIETLAWLTPDTAAFLGLAHNQPTEDVLAGIGKLGFGSQISLEELGVVDREENRDGTSLVLTDHGLKVIQLAAIVLKPFRFGDPITDS